MIASFIYLLARRVLSQVLLRLRFRQYKDLEMVVLSQEVAILRRQVHRVGCTYSIGPAEQEECSRQLHVSHQSGNDKARRARSSWRRTYNLVTPLLPTYSG